MRAFSRLAAALADRRGGAIIEFSIVGPVLFTILLAVVDVGRMFYVRQSLEYATEEAARYYMLNPTASTSTITTYLKSKMAGGMGTGISASYTDTVSCNASSSVTCTLIDATYSFTFATSYLGIGTTTLRAKAQAVRVQ